MNREAESWRNRYAEAARTAEHLIRILEGQRDKHAALVNMLADPPVIQCERGVL